MIDKTTGYVRDSAGNAVSMARHFFKMEASGGIILVCAAIAALIIANSPLYPAYSYIFDEVNFRIGFSDIYGAGFALDKSLLLWINDGLMAIFFFLIGLEIKREIMEGELSGRARALLPALAAIGGMVVPALIFWYLNQDDPESLSGWAIPAATDIAFALGVLALVGSRAPASLKVLLAAIAIIDDLGAILIIAIFYSHGFHIEPLYVAALALVILFALNRFHVSKLAPYVLTGFVLWIAVLESGVHATLAGVVAALFVPLSCKKRPEYSPAKTLEHGLHPWIAFGVLPLFGFANAGVSFAGVGFDTLLSPVTLGIALGLFVGKQLGVFGMLWLAVVTGLSPKPKDANWLHLYAVALLCGIGFTMSLFIGALAYDGNAMQASVRIGVLLGSVLSAGLAYLLLRYAPTKEVLSRST